MFRVMYLECYLCLLRLRYLNKKWKTGVLFLLARIYVSMLHLFCFLWSGICLYICSYNRKETLTIEMKVRGLTSMWNTILQDNQVLIFYLPELIEMQSKLRRWVKKEKHRKRMKEEDKERDITGKGSRNKRKVSRKRIKKEK